MLNAINLVGTLGPLTDGLTRQILVQRPYREDHPTPVFDELTVMHWSRNRSVAFYKVEEKSIVAIKGRLERHDQEFVIIAENISYL